tara:strand:- start:3801 stop:4046 length:246 start_codon:yes stop_codon:yes gene_type:complete
MDDKNYQEWVDQRWPNDFQDIYKKLDLLLLRDQYNWLLLQKDCDEQQGLLEFIEEVLALLEQDNRVLKEQQYRIQDSFDGI